MSIDMILGMAESQTQDIKNLVTKQNEAYTELQKKPGRIHTPNR